MPTAEKRGKEIKLYNATDLNTAAATILKKTKKTSLGCRPFQYSFRND
jgi:hypothetical protein